MEKQHEVKLQNSYWQKVFNLRKQFPLCDVWSMIFCGMEMWTLSNKEIKYLEF